MRVSALAILGLALPAVAAAHDMPLPATPTDDDDVELAAPTTLATIEIRGLRWTHPSVVERELGVREGERIEPAEWTLAVTRLWNLGLFSRVNARLRREGPGKVVARLLLEERWTLNPLFSFARGGGTYYVNLGASEANLGGRAVELAGLWQYFAGYHGGMAYLRDPRLFGRRWDGMIGGDLLVRPRPGFSDRGAKVRAEIGHLMQRDTLRAGVRLEAFSCEVLPSIQGPDELPPPVTGAFVEPALRIGRVDTKRLFHIGTALELRQSLGVARAVGPAAPFTWGVAELQTFSLLSATLNLALRAQAGWNAGTPVQYRAWLGGLDRVRGYVDNRISATRYAFANIELRWLAWDTTWLAVMPAAFVDGAIARDDRQDLLALAAVGGGVRLLVPRFVRTGLRIDVAAPLAADRCRAASGLPFTGGCVGTSIGVYQFF
jgi:hypothetical protein